MHTLTTPTRMLRFHELRGPLAVGDHRKFATAPVRPFCAACRSGVSGCEDNITQKPLQALHHAVANVVLPAILALSCTACPAAAVELSRENPLYDGAKIVSSELRTKLSNQLTDFEERTGWRLRVYTNYGLDGRPTDADRRSWQLDRKSVVLQFDPSSPNILNLYYVGDDALFKLRRPFWTELQSRFGNMFYVREQGEQAAVVSTIDALTACLAKEDGCRVVPGLPADQYSFTLGLSVAAGLILGFVTQLEPQGFVQRRWVWALIFSPLWASTFINFGLGPVITRTDDLTPVAANTAAFLLTAGTFLLRGPLSRSLQSQGPSDDS